MKLKHKSRDTKLNENLRVTKEAEERDKALREAQVTLETHKILFPMWSMVCIMSEVIDNLSVYWLEPAV